jgi:hypothetical protein
MDRDQEGEGQIGRSVRITIGVRENGVLSLGGLTSSVHHPPHHPGGDNVPVVTTNYANEDGR